MFEFSICNLRFAIKSRTPPTCSHVRPAPQSQIANCKSKIPYNPSMPIAALRSLLRPDQVLSDPAELFVYESDGFTVARARPAAVVFPE